MVSSEINDGNPSWVCLNSRLGKVCKVENPWKVAHLYRNGSFETSFEAEIIELSTKRKDLLMLVPNKETMEHWKTQSLECGANTEPKVGGSANMYLGLPRLF